MYAMKFSSPSVLAVWLLNMALTCSHGSRGDMASMTATRCGASLFLQRPGFAQASGGMMRSRSANSETVMRGGGSRSVNSPRQKLRRSAGDLFERAIVLFSRVLASVFAISLSDAGLHGQQD